MKTLQTVFLIGTVFVLFFTTLPLIRAQGFVYLSNTNQNVTDNFSGDFGITFLTGSNASGYVLNTVTLQSANNEIPILSSAFLYDYSSYIYFQDSHEISSAGFYTFTANLPILLTANTPYEIWIIPADPLAGGGINVSYTTSSTFTSSDNWNISGLGGSDEPLFAITATPAPEPTVRSLVCASVLVLFVSRIKRRGLNQKALF
jgi:hypothetical protein